MVVLDGPVLRLGKSKNALLRRATYQVFVAVLKIPFDVITAAGLAKVAKLVMGLFGEREAANHGALWNLLLRFSRRYPVCMRVGGTVTARCQRLAPLPLTLLFPPTLSQLCCWGADYDTSAEQVNEEQIQILRKMTLPRLFAFLRTGGLVLLRVGGWQ